jgi:transcriptional regulator with XRE-family HTH domain
MLLGDKLRDLRIKKDVSQEEVATAIGKSPKTISAWENNNKSPRMGTLSALARYFNVPITYFIEDSTQTNKSTNKSFWGPIEYWPSDNSSDFLLQSTKKAAVERYTKLFSEHPELIQDAQEAYSRFVKTLYDTVSSLPLTTNADETTLLTLFRQLDDEKKKTALALVNTLANQK